MRPPSKKVSHLSYVGHRSSRTLASASSYLLAANQTRGSGWRLSAPVLFLPLKCETVKQKLSGSGSLTVIHTAQLNYHTTFQLYHAVLFRDWKHFHPWPRTRGGYEPRPCGRASERHRVWVTSGHRCSSPLTLILVRTVSRCCFPDFLVKQ